MPIHSIKNNLFEFNQALNEKIDIDKQGNWYRVNWFMRIVYVIFSCLNDDRVARVANAFSRFLDETEKTPVKFNRGLSTDNLQNSVDITICKLAGQTLTHSLASCYSTLAKQSRENLQHRIVALNYRFEAENEGQNKQTAPDEIVSELKRVALIWKQQQKLMDGNDKLTAQDEALLGGLAQYRDFFTIIKNPENHTLRERVFKWIIRDHLDADVLVECPGQADVIHDAHLQHGLGYYSDKMLRLVKRNNEKHVEVRFNGQFESILDIHRKVDLGRGCITSISNVFHQMSDKNHAYGEFNFSSRGLHKSSVVNLNEVINLDDSHKNNWWEQSKCMESLCVRILSPEETKARYGQQCDGVNWAGRLMATRETAQLEPKGTHAYVEIAIPDQTGNYRVFTFGKSANQLPRSPWEYASAIAKTFDGRIISPDPSIYQPRRQHRGTPFVMSQSEGHQVMEWIRQSITNGLKDNMAYQLFTENCAAWALEITKILGNDRVPSDAFTVHFAASVPPGILKHVFVGIMKLAHNVQNIFFSIFFGVLGSFSSKTVTDKDGKPHVVSLSRLKPWTYPKNEKFNIPAAMIMKQDQGLLPCSAGTP